MYAIQRGIWQRSPGRFHQSDKDASLDSDLLTSCLISNSLSFNPNPDSMSEPPTKSLKAHTSLGWCFMSGYGAGMLMEVGRRVEDRVLKHHPLSWRGRKRSDWLMLLGVKEERSKCYLDLCKFAPTMRLYHVYAPHTQAYHWALDLRPWMRRPAIIQRHALNRRLS